MINVEQDFGLSGEFQVIVRRADGSIKLDTGMQPNLILDNGIKHYLHLKLKNSAGVEQETSNYDFMAHCLVGTGNTEPVVSDFALQHSITIEREATEYGHDVEYPETGKHEGFVKLWKQKKYIFDNINNQNITEVGLATWHGDETIADKEYRDVYSLVTRALIKDSGGSPIAVTVLKGEVLEVIYRINMYVDIKRKTGSFTLTTTKDSQDTTETFDYFMQPYDIESGVEYHIDDWIKFNAYSNGITSWGVKEQDSELTADYDLNAEGYANITYNDTSSFAQMVSGSSWSRTSYGDAYSNYHLNTVYTERSFETRRVTYENTSGIYTHNYPNGIRAFKISVDVKNYTVVAGLVVVKNRANGQGIKKTDRQLWEFSFSFTINRWEG